MPLDGFGPVGQILGPADGWVQARAPNGWNQHAAHTQALQRLKLGPIGRKARRDLERGGIAPGALRCLARDGDQPSLLASIGKESIAESARPARRGLGVAADDDRHRLVDGLGPTERILERDEATAERRLLGPPEFTESSDILISPRPPLCEGNAECR